MDKSKSPWTLGLQVNETISKWPSLRSIKDDWQGLHQQPQNVVAEEDFDWTVNHLNKSCAWFSRLLNSNRKQYRSIKFFFFLLCGIFAGFITMFILHFSFAFSLKAMGFTGMAVAIVTSVLLIFCYGSRCVLSLVIPSLGTRQGKTIMMTIMAAQLLSGPLGNLTYNLKQTTNSLVCFSNMTVNQTQQTIKGIKNSVNNFTNKLVNGNLGQVVDTFDTIENIGNAFSSMFHFSFFDVQKKVKIPELYI